MKIALISPDPLKQETQRKNRSAGIDSSNHFFSFYYRPDLSLLNLASVTPQNHDITIYDDAKDNISFDTAYDIVGITGMTNNILRAYQLADGFRSQGTKVILGGWHPSALPNEAIQHADSVVIGEAEGLWQNILKNVEGKNLDRFYHSNQPVDLRNMPPLIDERKLNRHRYLVETVEATRGCPLNCYFCSATNQEYFQVFRARPIDTVVTEIMHLSSKFFSFIDPSITYNPGYARSLFEALKSSDKRFACNITMAVVERDDILLKLGAEAGLTQVFIGLESSSPHTLEQNGKKIEEYQAVVRKLHDYGISVLGAFIFGFDSDTPKVFDDSLDVMRKSEIDLAGCSVLTPFPGTPVFEEYDQNCRLLTRDWSKYYGGQVVYKPKQMTPYQLQEGVNRVAKSFYSTHDIIKRLYRSVHMGLYPFLSVLRENISFYRWTNQIY